jgi:uncharacterized protein YlxW (UPF0749 family)
MAEASEFRALKMQVETLQKQVADLTRRLDDFSKADRARLQDRETLKLKHG